jgi:hypothetical protein
LGSRHDGRWKEEEGMEGWMNRWKDGGSDKGKTRKKRTKRNYRNYKAKRIK